MTEKNNIPNEAQHRLNRYLRGEMSHEEQHEFEKEHADDPFLDDAIEGLQSFDKGSNIDRAVHSLNNSLRQQLSKRKARRRNKASQPSWMYFTIILILLLAVIAFIVVRYYR